MMRLAAMWYLLLIGRTGMRNGRGRLRVAVCLRSATGPRAGPNRVMHKKAGLCLLTALITRPGGLTFAKLKRQCALTGSNQSLDMKVLQDNGLVKGATGNWDNRPHTHTSITAKGQQQFLVALTVLEQVVQDAAKFRNTVPDPA